MPATLSTALSRTRVIASLRDQRLDVRLGLITEAEWEQRRDLAAVALADAGNLPLPADLTRRP
jgi:hypothetical protein